MLDARRVLDGVSDWTPEHPRHYARVELNLADVLAKENRAAESAVAAGQSGTVPRTRVRVPEAT